jgi:hypothetical protein
MAVKYTNIFHYKIYPNGDFWHEKIPSGNPESNPFAQLLLFVIAYYTYTYIKLFKTYYFIGSVKRYLKLGMSVIIK